MIIRMLILFCLYLSFSFNALYAGFKVFCHDFTDTSMLESKHAEITAKKNYKNAELVWGGDINIRRDEIESAKVILKDPDLSLACSISTKSKEKARKLKLHLKEIRTSKLPEISVNQASRSIKKLREASFEEHVYIEGPGIPWEVWSYFHFPKERIVKIQPSNYILCKNGYFFANYEIYYKDKTIEMFCLRLPQTLENLQRIVE